MSTTSARRRRWGLAVLGALVTLFFLAPYSVMFMSSLRTSGDVKTTPPSFLPREWQWDTYVTVLSDERFLAWLRTSLLVAVASTLIVIAVAIPAAYMTARYRFVGAPPSSCWCW